MAQPLGPVLLVLFRVRHLAYGLHRISNRPRMIWEPGVRLQTILALAVEYSHEGKSAEDALQRHQQGSRTPLVDLYKPERQFSPELFLCVGSNKPINSISDKSYS